ncbi:MAG: hypothetical protein KJ621_17755 [Proteobacteria bacterium]|nr:hypothetical protein [Pseudomonadota bacterium]
MSRLKTAALVLAILVAAPAVGRAPAQTTELVHGYRLGYAAAGQLKTSGRATTYARFVRLIGRQLDRHAEHSPDFRRGLFQGAGDYYRGRSMADGLRRLK